MTAQSNSPLLQQLQSNMALRQMSSRTIAAYTDWVRRYVRFHRLRHPAEMGEAEVREFLVWLVERRRVSQSTQGQALAALLFLYRHVLDRGGLWGCGVRRMGWLQGASRGSPIRWRVVPLSLDRSRVGGSARGSNTR